MGKLTAAQVKNAKLKSDGRQKKLFDGGGLYLLINKTGKYWRYDYRFLKKRKTLSLGVYPEVSLKEAREKHTEARKSVADYIDPAHLRKVTKTAGFETAKNSFQILPRQLFANPKWTAESQYGNPLLLNNKIYETLFENNNDAVLYFSRDGIVRHLNKNVEKIHGLKAKDIVGKHFTETMGHCYSQDTLNNVQALYTDLINRGQSKVTMELEGLHINGTVFFVECTTIIVKEDEIIKGTIFMLRDISTRKEAEKKLIEAYNEMESMVKKRTANLEQTNIALKVLLKQREEDKAELEDKVVMNIKELILPYIEEWENSKSLKQHQALADIIKYNLNEIVSPFATKLTSRHYNLSLTEIRIANLIKQGKTTKEIADQLKLSSRTVDTHRYRIRKKLGISRKKTNLATHLQTVI